MGELMQSSSSTASQSACTNGQEQDGASAVACTTGELVRRSFAELSPNLDQLVDRFCQRIYREHPGLRYLYATFDPLEQRRTLILSLTMIVRFFDAPQRFTKFLSDVGQRYAELGGDVADYEPAARTWLTVLAEQFGASWNDRYRAAWNEVLYRASLEMRRGAARVSFVPNEARPPRREQSVATPVEQTQAAFGFSPEGTGDTASRPTNRSPARRPDCDSSHDVRNPITTTHAVDANSADDCAHTETGTMITANTLDARERTTPETADADDVSRIREELNRTSSMLENIPINVLMADREFTLVYMNPASKRTLRQLEHLLPKPVDQLIGEKIDIFHKRPEHQRGIVSNPKNLPHRAKIQLGDETLDLLVSPIMDPNGRFLGPMVTWNLVTREVNLAKDVMDVVNVVKGSSGELQGSAKSMAATAEETAQQAQTVAAAAEEATKNVETVASAAEELSTSIAEIARHVQDAARISSEAVSEADSANDTIKHLGESSNEIGHVIKVITSIAQQTNLLALNATIEAARAGEAGKGFAVVANEVKELARQTAKATEEISQKIEAIQASTGVAVTAIGSIRGIINRISEISTTIAAAVEQQTAATEEISRNVCEAARGTAEVTGNIVGVSQAAAESTQGSQDILSSSTKLSQEAERLQHVVSTFLGEQ
jgi:hemoglobin-like flavoprotein